VAPSFAPAALDVLRARRNLRLLATGGWLGPDHVALTKACRRRSVQDRDATAAGR
jgi:phosphoribosylaminoimidazolecarboxamide formyltransferase/IMP cyclohydrolase